MQGADGSGQNEGYIHREVSEKSMIHSQPRKKPSKIWNHFTLTLGKKKAICLHCNSELAYSMVTMSNLHRHIKNKHAHIFLTEFNKLNSCANSANIENAPVEVITLQEVDGTFEISTKGFEEIEEMNQVDGVATDTEWVPEMPEEEVKMQNSPEVKNPRKFSKRSVIWNHFERSADKTTGTCHHCNKMLRIGTTSNLARHMRHRHPNIQLDNHSLVGMSEATQNPTNQVEGEFNFQNGIEICTEVIEINPDENPVNLIDDKTGLGNDSSEMELPGEKTALGHYLNEESQTEFLDGSDDFDISDFIRPKKRAVVAEQVDHQLVKTLLKCCLPINLVEEPNFKELVSFLNSKYVLPSSNKVSKELIPNYYIECEKRARISLNAAEGISLYLDQWKSNAKLYLCVTAHFINSECEFESLFLNCIALPQNVTRTSISEMLLKTVKDWEIENKILAVVTDNAENIAVAVALCNWLHIPNFVQTLTLVVHECLKEVKQIITKVNQILEEITEQPDMLAKIYSAQKRLKLPQGKLISKVKNEWNSSFTILEMLTRFVNLKDAINVVMLNPSTKLNEHEWKLIASVVEILRPFKDVKKEVMVEERVAMSKVVFYIRALKRQMEIFQTSHTLCNSATYIATVAEAALTAHFEGIENHNLINNTLLLDPRMKRFIFKDESEFASACSKLKKEVCEVTIQEKQVREPDPKSLWRFFDEEVNKMNTVVDPIGKGILEIDRYLQEQLLERNGNPLVWWKERSAIYPRLLKLAKKYLCLTAKSGSREAISYKSAYMLSQLKNNKNLPTATEVMFLHHNMS